MIAETVYNVAQVLSPSEKQRLIDMLSKDQKPAIATQLQAQKKSNVWTVAECTEVLLRHLRNHKQNRMKPPANADSSEQPEIMTRIISGDADNLKALL